MVLRKNDVAELIDISAVHAYDGVREIDGLVAAAEAHAFGAVHVLPSWVSYVRNRAGDAPTFRIGAPIGFPAGGTLKEVKIFETRTLAAAGADEFDMMINVGKLLSGDYAYVEDEIRSVVGSTDLPAKVIIEVSYLGADLIKRVCELCIKAGAAYVKTGTGWTGASTSMETVSLITSFVKGAIKVKVAGGVRKLDNLIELYKLGVDRFGINAVASEAILTEIESLPDQSVTVSRE